MPRPLSSRPTPKPEPQVPEDDAAAQFIGGATSLPPQETTLDPVPVPSHRKRRKALIPINTRLPEELVDLLDEAANHTGIPRQQIIADALAKYLPKLMKSAG
jgi:hypothetical protein